MKSQPSGAPRRGVLKCSGLVALTFAVMASLLAVLSVPAQATGSTGGGDEACTYEWVREVPQSHTEYKYKKTIPAVAGVKEYKYKKAVKAYKTQHWAKYQKHVRGKIQKKVSKSWVNYGSFDWEKWQKPTWNTSGSFKVRDWADVTSPDAIEEGGHGGTSVSYASGGYTYRKISERYGYRVIERQTRQVETSSSWEYTDWTTEARGTPWVKVEERWKIQPQAAYDLYYLTGGGSSPANTDANWTRETPGSPWVEFDRKSVLDPSIKQGPVRSSTEPDRGQYPSVPWTKVPGSAICPGGSNTYTLDCESITLNTPTGVTPTGSQTRYLIDGVEKLAGTHMVSVGSHTITLQAFVKGAWRKVDEDKVSIQQCASGGSVKYETTCETLKLHAPTGVEPMGSEARYLLDGVVKAPGIYTLAAGSYELTLEVKVNGTWRQVDRNMVVIEACKPAPAASGKASCKGFVIALDNTKGTAEATFVVTTPTRSVETVKVAAGKSALRTYPVIEDRTATVAVKSDGMKSLTLSYKADCVKPKAVKGSFKKLDKCEFNNFVWLKPVKGAHYTYKGKTLKEGRWLKLKAKTVKIKVVADNRNFEVKGKKVLVAKFTNHKKCPAPPKDAPRTGMSV